MGKHATIPMPWMPENIAVKAIRGLCANYVLIRDITSIVAWESVQGDSAQVGPSGRRFPAVHGPEDVDGVTRADGVGWWLCERGERRVGAQRSYCGGDYGGQEQTKQGYRSNSIA